MSIKWQRYERRPGVWLRLHPDMHGILFEDVDKQLDVIASWCRDNHCGRRMAYDMWQFEDESQLTAFLLSWS